MLFGLWVALWAFLKAITSASFRSFLEEAVLRVTNQNVLTPPQSIQIFNRSSLEGSLNYYT